MKLVATSYIELLIIIEFWLFSECCLCPSFNAGSLAYHTPLLHTPQVQSQSMAFLHSLRCYRHPDRLPCCPLLHQLLVLQPPCLVYPLPAIARHLYKCQVNLPLHCNVHECKCAVLLYNDGHGPCRSAILLKGSLELGSLEVHLEVIEEPHLFAQKQAVGVYGTVDVHPPCPPAS